MLQCPMFTIHDAPDPAPVEAWIRRFIEQPVRRPGADHRRRPAPADEGGAANRARASHSSPRSARSRKFARGPKPGRALREIGLEAARSPRRSRPPKASPRCWRGFDLTGRRVGLQLYPDKDHSALIGAIEARGAERRYRAALCL